MVHQLLVDANPLKHVNVLRQGSPISLHGHLYGSMGSGISMHSAGQGL